MNDAPLVIELPHHGSNCRVFLNGVEISQYLNAIEVSAKVDGLTTAKLTYTGAVVVRGEAGQVHLEQAPLFVQCRECQQTLQGHAEAPTIVDATALGDDTRRRAVVAEP